MTDLNKFIAGGGYYGSPVARIKANQYTLANSGTSLIQKSTSGDDPHYISIGAKAGFRYFVKMDTFSQGDVITLVTNAPVGSAILKVTLDTSSTIYYGNGASSSDNNLEFTKSCTLQITKLSSTRAFVKVL